MSKIVRALQKIFGYSSSEVITFGSDITLPIVHTTNVETIQSLPAWSNGWSSALNGGVAALENQNSVNYVTTKQIAYLMQEGIAEYNAQTTYYIGSIAKKAGTTQLYKSIVDNNANNALTNVSYWSLLGDLSDLGGGSSFLDLNGYVILNSGVIIQWGKVNAPSLDTQYPVVFRMAFPNACLSVIPATINSTTSNDDIIARLISISNTGAVIRTEKSASYTASPSTRYLGYIAIGY